VISVSRSTETRLVLRFVAGVQTMFVLLAVAAVDMCLFFGHAPPKNRYPKHLGGAV